MTRPTYRIQKSGETHGYTSPDVLLLIKLLVSSAVAGQAANVSHRWLQGLAVHSRKKEDRDPARTHSSPGLAYTFASNLCVASVCAEAVNRQRGEGHDHLCAWTTHAGHTGSSRSDLSTALDAGHCSFC